MTNDASSQRGRRTLVNILDDVAAVDPSRIICSQPRAANLDKGWNEITYAQASNAVAFVAYELASNLGIKAQAENGRWPTIAYIGPGDWRYVIFTLACLKAGCVAFFISPRNSVEGQQSLFQSTGCQVIYYAEPYDSLVKRWLAQSPMQSIRAPSLEACLTANTRAFPYRRPLEQARWDPLMILHTSGSTGIPKPITIRQGGVMVWDGSLSDADMLGLPSIWKHWSTVAEKCFLPMPFFHASGALCGLMFTLCAGKQIVLPAVDTPLTADSAAAHMLSSGANTCVLPPSVIEDMAFTDDGLAALAAQSMVLSGGGNLSQLVGDILTKQKIQICNMIGCTEYFTYPLHLQTDPALWHYFIFDEEKMGAEWDPVDWEDDVYELVVKRKAQDPGVQAIFFTFPDAWTWRSRDLYKRHPSLPHHWAFFGRADDVIVFSNGEKLNPVTIEGLIYGCEQVKGAIVAGQDRFQPLLVLEVKEHPTTDAERDALLDSIWPLVEKANETTVAHGRISRWMMMIASLGTPFVRSPKGTVQRGATYKLLAEQIDAFYQGAGVALLDEELIDLDATDQDRLTLSLVNLFRRKSGIDEITQDTDLFTAGVDSLQVLGISTILKASVNKSGAEIDPYMLNVRSVYNNPTPQLLAKYIIDTANIAGEGSFDASDGTAALESLVARYTTNLPASAKEQTWKTAGEGQTVLLTGSTGSLGAYILDILCHSTSVAKIFALNRGEDGGKSRQPGITAKYGLGSDFSKVSFVSVDLSQTKFGLADDIFDELARSADVIIHNAWPVNFNMSVVSFEPHIRGVRHLVDFSCAAKKRVPIVFVSSVGTVQNWTQPDLVPETRLEDPNLAQMGYGQSKLAASMVLDAAAAACGISVANIRVGQVAGSKREVGLWNPQEYLPSLVASSVYMGMIPGDLGPQEQLDWMAIEDVAGFITDVAGITAEVSESTISGYFNCVNPRTTTWQTLVPVIQGHYADRIHKKVIFEEWVRALEQSAGGASVQAAELKENRGLKLLDAYRGFLEQKLSGRTQVQLSTSRGQAFSPTMAKMEAVTPQMMKNWCAQWDRNTE